MFASIFIHFNAQRSPHLSMHFIKQSRSTFSSPCNLCTNHTYYATLLSFYSSVYSSVYYGRRVLSYHEHQASGRPRWMPDVHTITMSPLLLHRGTASRYITGASLPESADRAMRHWTAMASRPRTETGATCPAGCRPLFLRSDIKEDTLFGSG